MIYSKTLRRRWLALGVTVLCMATAAGAMTATPAEAVELGCRQRQALQRAIAQANTAGVGEIHLASNCIYEITTPSTADTGTPLITGDVTIVGGESTIIARSAAAASAFRLFEVDVAGKLTLRSLTITKGETTGVGGGVLTAGTLVLDAVSMADNKAANGGAVSVQAGASATITDSAFALNSTTSVGGGAIIDFGTLKVVRSVFSNNFAPVNGGAINVQPGATAKLVDSSFEYNRSGSLGGALANLGSVLVRRSTIRLNTGSSGGGIATGNANVVIGNSTIKRNVPDNCNPLNTIPGCTD